MSDQHGNRVSVSVISPVYRSEKSLREYYRRVSAALDSVSNDWEIILVDDASPDGSWSELQNLREQDDRVKIIRLAHNHGQQKATLCGLGYASKDYVFTIDDDLQCFPEDIPKFLERLQANAEVVIGAIPSGEKQHAAWRNLGSKLNSYVIGKVLKKPRSLRLSSFRGFRQRTCRQLGKYRGAHPHIAALLLNSVPHNLIENVEIRHTKRADNGAGSYTIRKLIKTLSYILINHSYLPLRFMTVWGVIVSIASLSYAFWVVTNSLRGHLVPGWASIAVLTSFLSGNILLALGVLGEYVGRLVEETRGTSQFVVFEESI